MPTRIGAREAINNIFPIFLKACPLVKKPRINPKAINRIINKAKNGSSIPLAESHGLAREYLPDQPFP